MTTTNIKDMIPCEVEKVWETVTAFEHYRTWWRNVSKIEVVNEKQFIEYSREGYSTTFTITKTEPLRRLELDVENSSTKGHWTIVFASRGGETEVDFTAGVTAKQLSTRPVGKGVFETVYSKKEMKEFVADLKKAVGEGL